MIGMAKSRDGHIRVFRIDAIPADNLCRDMTSNAVTVTAMSNPHDKVLTEDNVFVNLRKMELAMCGPLFFRAREIEKELQKVRINWAGTSDLSRIICSFQSKMESSSVSYKKRNGIQDVPKFATCIRDSKKVMV